MNSLLVVNICIVLSHILILVNITTAKKAKDALFTRHVLTCLYTPRRVKTCNNILSTYTQCNEYHVRKICIVSFILEYNIRFSFIMCKDNLYATTLLLFYTRGGTRLRDSGSCKYLGGIDPKNKRCHKDKVKFKKLPHECSAYIYDGMNCTSTYQILPRYSTTDLENIRSLIDLKGDDGEFHDVYTFYVHETIQDFGEAIFIENGEAEAQGVKKFIGDYPVKGLILGGIDKPIIFEAGDDFHKNFTAYVRTIKTVNPGLEIGFYLSARYLTQVSINGDSSIWYDFVKMNDVLDFYLIEFTTFNECVNELLQGGITPIDSLDKGILTLNKFADAFKNCTIDKEKVYFEFLINPKVMTKIRNTFFLCEISYNEYCENHKNYDFMWCVDTQDMLYEKGKFAKQYSKGFVGSEIDLVDRDNKCKCDNKYITFYMMLRGYNNEDPLTCDAYARPT
ncbi:hypothetical protein QTP88_017602 [Uroleucon formosanum]